MLFTLTVRKFFLNGTACLALFATAPLISSESSSPSEPENKLDSNRTAAQRELFDQIKLLLGIQGEYHRASVDTALPLQQREKAHELWRATEDQMCELQRKAGKLNRTPPA